MAHGRQQTAQCTEWSPPPAGFVKLNIDVSMDFLRRKVGFGWILRDSTGVVIGVIMLKQEGIFSVREAEAIGAREALSWQKQHG